MFKLLSLFLLAIGLVACSGEGDSNTSPTENNNTSSTENNNTSPATTQTAVVITKDNFGQLAKGSNIIILDTGAVAPSGVALSPDGALVAVSYPEGVALVTLSDNSIRTITGHEDAVNDVAFSPDGTLLATASRDKTVKIWNVSSGEVVTTITHPNDNIFRLVAFSPDGSQVAAASDFTTVYVFTVTSGEEVARLSTVVNTNIADVTFTADGASLMVASGDGAVRFWDVASAEETSQISIGTAMGTSVGAVSLSADGAGLVISNGASGGFFVYDVQSGERVAEQTTQYIHPKVAYNPDGTFFIGVWNFGGGKIAAYDPATAEKIGTELDNGGTIADIAFSADGTTIAVASMSAGQTVLTLWRVQ